MSKEIIISERENIAATFEDGKIVDFFMNEGEQLVGDIILGKVDSVVQSIDAAFVSIGKNRNGFIHVTDLAIAKNPRRKTGIKNHLRPKQTLLVQIAKEATGSKGPRLTCMLSIPGKYMVLTPFERKIGISKKIIEEQERERLIFVAKKICQSGYGLIVRTEAIGQSEEALKEDLDYLLKRWSEILKLSETAQAPAVLYRDQDLLYRVLRDSLTTDIEKIVLDTQETKNRAVELLQSWSNDAYKTVTLNKYPIPLALQYNLFTELEKALQPKVQLPSGGSLVIEHTEALTVIDVNSGSTRGTNNLNETILQTNKEAALEIGRQIRIRDIGGVIVIDFIDMIDPREQQIVWQILANSVKNDKAQPQLGYFSEFSLLEITRHRQRKSLEQMLTNKCPYCDGVGRIRNNVYRADLLSPESIKNRVPVPESVKYGSEETSRIKTEDFTLNVDYVENKMDRIPPEIAKLRSDNNSTRDFSYFKQDKTENDYEVHEVELDPEKDEIPVDVEIEKPQFERPQFEKPRFEKPHFEKPRFEKPRFEKPRFEKPRFEKPHQEKPQFEKPQFEKPQFEKPHFEKPHFDKKKKVSFSDEERRYIESIDSYDDYEEIDNNAFIEEEKHSESEERPVEEFVSIYTDSDEQDFEDEKFESFSAKDENHEKAAIAEKDEDKKEVAQPLPDMEPEDLIETEEEIQEKPAKKPFKKGTRAGGIRGKKPFKKKADEAEQLSFTETVQPEVVKTEPVKPKAEATPVSLEELVAEVDIESSSSDVKKPKKRRIRSFSPKKKK